jgi:hypothetical protein
MVYLMTVSGISGKIALKGGTSVNKTLDMICEEIFVGYLEKLCLRLPAGLRNTKIYIILDSQRFEQGTSRIEVRSVTLWNNLLSSQGINHGE